MGKILEVTPNAGMQGTLKEWHSTKDKINRLKEKEWSLRKHLSQQLALDEGVPFRIRILDESLQQNVELGVKENVKVDPSTAQSVANMISEPFDLLFGATFKLNMGYYSGLSPEKKSKVELTLNRSMGGLTIKSTPFTKTQVNR